MHPADPYDFDVDKADEQPGPVDSSPGATHAAASTGQQLESFTISRPPAANKVLARILAGPCSSSRCTHAAAI